MLCSNCQIRKAEVCQECSAGIKERVQNLKQKLVQKYGSFEPKTIPIKEMNQKQCEKKRNNKIILELQKDIQQLQDRSRLYQNIRKTIEQNLEYNRKQSQQDSQIMVMRQCLQTMNKRCEQNGIQIAAEKRKLKQVLSAIARTFDLDSFKYRIKKYFRYQETNKILDTKIEQMNGVEFISYIKQLKIQYIPQQNQLFLKDIYWLLSVIKYSIKFFFEVYRNLLNLVKLPYQMEINQQFCYIGNIAIEFNNNLSIQSPRLIQLLNLLQANILYVSYAYGVQEPPFLVIDQLFLQKIEKKNFRPASKNSYPPVYLQALKPSKILEYRIQDHIEFDTGIFLIKKDSGISIESEQIEIIQQSSEQNDDEVYQILQ